MRSAIRFKEDSEVVPEELPASKKGQKRSRSQIPKKPILKNININKQEEQDKLKAMPAEPEYQLSRQRYAQLLAMPNEDLLKLDPKEVYALINFMGLDQFLAMFEFEQQEVDQLFELLALYNNKKK